MKLVENEIKEKTLKRTDQLTWNEVSDQVWDQVCNQISNEVRFQVWWKVHRVVNL